MASQLLERRQSYDRIPRFFFPKSDGADDTALSDTSRAVCRKQALERIDALALTPDELARLTTSLCRYANAPTLSKFQTILLDKKCTPSTVVCVDRLLRDRMTLLLSYSDWQAIVGAMESDKVARMLSAEVFLMLPPDSDGRVNGLAVLEYVHQLQCTLLTTRFLLAQPEGTIDGMFSERDLETILQRRISEAIGDEKLVHIDTDFVPYYALICTRVILLRHDFQGSRSLVSIDDVVACPVFLEWFRLMDRDLHSLFLTDTNRFTPDEIGNLHRQYVQLDCDKNGMLSADELLDFGKKKAFNPIALTPTHDLTRAFVTHVFHETPAFPPDNEMDYKAYIDLTVRMTDHSSLASLRFFWNVLDIQKQGFLDAFTIDYFLRDLVEHMHSSSSDNSFPSEEPLAATVVRLRTQVFDLVAPRDPLRITWRDLTECKLGHLIVRMLTDTVAYRAYEACDGKFAVTSGRI